MASAYRELEVDEQERAILIWAERIAEEFGVELDQVLRELQEVCERIERWGLQPELRRLAQELGMSEERVRALHEAGMDKYAPATGYHPQRRRERQAGIRRLVTPAD